MASADFALVLGGAGGRAAAETAQLRFEEIFRQPADVRDEFRLGGRALNLERNFQTFAASAATAASNRARSPPSPPPPDPADELAEVLASLVSVASILKSRTFFESTVPAPVRFPMVGRTARKLSARMPVGPRGDSR